MCFVSRDAGFASRCSTVRLQALCCGWRSDSDARKSRGDIMPVRTPTFTIPSCLSQLSGLGRVWQASQRNQRATASSGVRAPAFTMSESAQRFRRAMAGRIECSFSSKPLRVQERLGCSHEAAPSSCLSRLPMVRWQVIWV